MNCSNKEVFDILCKREKEIYGVGILWIACGAARVTIIVYGSHDGFENKGTIGSFPGFFNSFAPSREDETPGSEVKRGSRLSGAPKGRTGLSHVAFVSFKHKVRSLSKHSKDGNKNVANFDT